MHALIANIPQKRTIWLESAVSLLACYGGVLLVASFNTSETVQQKLFIKIIAWDPLIKQFHELAEQIETKTQKTPIFVPLDNFPIGSELSFYQAKFLTQGSIIKSYPVVGAHIFGSESLMYRYWSKKVGVAGKPLILISKELWRFDIPDLKKQVVELSKLKEVWSNGQGQGVKNIPFYYKVVQIKE